MKKDLRSKNKVSTVIFMLAVFTWVLLGRLTLGFSATETSALDGPYGGVVTLVAQSDDGLKGNVNVSYDNYEIIPGIIINGEINMYVECVDRQTCDFMQLVIEGWPLNYVIEGQSYWIGVSMSCEINTMTSGLANIEGMLIFNGIAYPINRNIFPFLFPGL